jgi:large subunit ribosomal protein L31e
MAEVKEIKREYNIPLRKEFQKAPMYKRSKKAVTAVKEFLIKHMKPAVDDKGRVMVRIGQNINSKIWSRGIKRPPHHVKVNAMRDKEGKVTAELVGFEYNERNPMEAVEEKVEKKAAKKEVKEEKKVEKKAAKEVKKEEPKVEAKKEEAPKVEEKTEEKK